MRTASSLRCHSSTEESPELVRWVPRGGNSLSPLILRTFPQNHQQVLALPCLFWEKSGGIHSSAAGGKEKQFPHEILYLLSWSSLDHLAYLVLL